MNLKKSFTAVAATVFMIATISACSPTPKHEGTGGYIDDSVVTTKVKAALLGEKYVGSSQITVNTFKGRVQLSGFVKSEAEAIRAIEAAQRVTGVREVDNALKIK